MSQVIHNLNGKIWIFTNHGFDTTVIKNTVQQIAIRLQEYFLLACFYASLMYAKCDDQMRMKLWDDIYSLAAGMNNP